MAFGLILLICWGTRRTPKFWCFQDSPDAVIAKLVAWQTGQVPRRPVSFTTLPPLPGQIPSRRFQCSVGPGADLLAPFPKFRTQLRNPISSPLSDLRKFLNRWYPTKQLAQSPVSVNRCLRDNGHDSFPYPHPLVNILGQIFHPSLQVS